MLLAFILLIMVMVYDYLNFIDYFGEKNES